MESDTSHDAGRDDLVETLIDHGDRFYRHGWVFATAGNLSARLSEETVVITATGRFKGELDPDDFVETQLGDLSADSDAPTSSDSVIHRTVYERLPEVGAVYHVHEPHAVAATVRHGTGRVAFRGFPMVKAFGQSDVQQGVEVPILPDTGRAEDLAEELDAHLETSDEPPEVPGIVAERHGLYAWGTSPAAARRHIEALAHLFECEILATEGR